VTTRKKDGKGGPPQGAFSAGAGKAAPKSAEPEEQPKPEAAPAPSGLGFSTLFPPGSGPPPGSGEVVLGDLPPEKPQRTSSSFPEALGERESHDAWTLERMSRQSTVPPVRSEEVDRLRELAMRSSLRPEAPPAEAGDAFDLIDRSRPSQQLDLVGEMEELYALDDLTGALRFAELVLGREPDNQQARRCADNCRRRLLSLYSSKIGDLQGIPVPTLGDNELRWLGLDHRAGFLLSRVDGISTVEDVLDVCGMPRLEALKTLVDLLDRGAIRVQRP
jgi:hypothetical protein